MSVSPEPELVIVESLDLIALLVDRPMMPPAQQREIRQRRGPALGPVPDVMALRDAHAAAREPTAAVAMLQRPP